MVGDVSGMIIALRKKLCEDVFDDVAVDISETKISPSIVEGELLMIETEEMKQCGVKIVDMHGFFHGGKAEFVGGPVDVAFFHPPTGEPHAEAEVIVITAVDVAFIDPGGGKFDGRGPAKFTTPNDERVTE